MELCNNRRDPFRFFLFFSERLFSFLISYFGKDVFHKILWVSSRDQAVKGFCYFEVSFDIKYIFGS